MMMAMPATDQVLQSSILVVDDDKKLQNLMKLILTKGGYEVELVNSGKEALEKLKSYKPDMILLDVMMPDMDGYEVCRILQDDPNTAYIPVIMVTARGEENDRKEGFKAGAVDYLTKPIKSDTLLDTISKYLDIKNQWENINSKTEVFFDEDKLRYFNDFKIHAVNLFKLGDKEAKIIKDMGPKDVYVKSSEAGIESDKMAQYLAEFFSMPYLANLNSNDVVLGVLPPAFCKSNLVLPLSDVANGIAFAVSNAFDLHLIDTLKSQRKVSERTKIIITNPENIKRIFDSEIEISNEDEDMGSVIFTTSFQNEEFEENEEEEQNDIADLTSMANMAPIIKLVNDLMAKAIYSRASDIHVEPRENSLGIRFRIDGVLREQDTLPKSITKSVLSRLKIMSGMNITETRLPQDGRLRVNYKSRNIDMRISTLPCRYGEKMVARILDAASVSLDFEALGFEPRSFELFRESIHLSNGIILITGPTGSGKTTTLYTALNALNDPMINLVTVEDPIEYEFHRINQVEVKSKIGMTFPAALRSILRQDPDVIMIGEIRDSETMSIATKAALTGHLVLSTIHTNDTVSTIVRLSDMGIEPFMVASTLQMVSAQRLLRKLCPKCKTQIEAPYDVAEKLNMEIGNEAVFYKPTGCKFCSNTGYKGRVVVEEVMRIDDHIRSLINQSADIGTIRNYAVNECGMMLLKENGFLKASKGVTSTDESMRLN
jgi:type IV pilus assembly protein PilB